MGTHPWYRNQRSQQIKKYQHNFEDETINPRRFDANHFKTDK